MSIFSKVKEARVSTMKREYLNTGEYIVLIENLKQGEDGMGIPFIAVEGKVMRAYEGSETKEGESVTVEFAKFHKQYNYLEKTARTYGALALGLSDPNSEFDNEGNEIDWDTLLDKEVFGSEQILKGAAVHYNIKPAMKDGEVKTNKDGLIITKAFANGVMDLETLKTEVPNLDRYKGQLSPAYDV